MTRSTSLMRVPNVFKKKVMEISNKRGYKSATNFLDEEGVRLFNNADRFTDLIFGRKKKK